MTTAATARAAGVTEPILYRHFPSKRALFHRLLEDVIQGMTQALQQLAEGARDPVDALRRICGGYPGLARRYEREFRVINRALAEAEDARTRALLREHYEAYESLLVRIIQAGQRQGLLRRDIPARLAAWHLIHTALGYLFTRPLGPAAHRDPAYETMLVEAALGGLLTGRTN